MSVEQLITTHLDIWTAADTEKKSGRGRSSGNAGSVYGIKKLRELILELAVRGKLVPQDESDEPASELLKRIVAEKAKLVAEGKIKKSKPLAEITDDEKPLEPITEGEKLFALPIGWEFVRLANIIKISSGDGLTSDQMDKSGNITVYGGNGVTGYHSISNVIKRTLVIGRVGYYCGSIHITPESAWVTDNAFITKFSQENISMSFLYWLLRITNLKENESATAQPVISGRKVYPIVVALPPFEEQHRIVAKVDELMALCDQLENQHNNAAEAHEKLVTQLLGTLTQSQNAQDFNTHWQLISEHFDTLFTSEASIDALKQTLLQLAVMGKLVPQDPNDEPASELLKRIQAEKAKLIAEGKIKKDKPLAEITDEDKPFELPHGWERINFGEIIALVSGQHLNPSEYFDKPKNGSIPYITGPADFGNEGPVPTRHTCERRALSIYGDILVTVKGSGVGKTNSVCQKELAISRQLMAVRPIIVNVNFIGKLLITLAKLFQELTVGIAIPGISREDVLYAVIEIPPIAEQHRIVAKVDELMAICDQLKAGITSANQLQQKLADVMTQVADC